MKVEFDIKKVQEVKLIDMPVGKYGVIVEAERETYLNMIVIRHDTDLFTAVSGAYWNAHFPKVKVRLLEPGESFTVTV